MTFYCASSLAAKCITIVTICQQEVRCLVLNCYFTVNSFWPKTTVPKQEGCGPTPFICHLMHHYIVSIIVAVLRCKVIPLNQTAEFCFTLLFKNFLKQGLIQNKWVKENVVSQLELMYLSVPSPISNSLVKISLWLIHTAKFTCSNITETVHTLMTTYNVLMFHPRWKFKCGFYVIGQYGFTPQKLIKPCI